MKPTAKEQAARQAVISQLYELTKEYLPSQRLEVFGSERTGLALAISDLDFRLYQGQSERADQLPEKAPRYEVRKKMTRHLTKLHEGLQKSGHYILCALRHARYPLI